MQIGAMQSEGYCGNQMIVPVKKLELAPGTQWRCLQGGCSEFSIQTFQFLIYFLKYNLQSTAMP